MQAVVAVLPPVAGAAPVAPAPPVVVSTTQPRGDTFERDAARAAAAAGKWDEARAHYARAVGANQKDADLWAEYGELLFRVSPTDPPAAAQAVDAWNRALAVKPDDAAVLKRLEAAHHRAVLFYPSAAHVGHLRELAQKVVGLDPKDKQAAADIQIATVAGWLYGYDTGGAAVNAAIEALVKLRPADPDNADLPYFAASAYVRQAAQAATSRDDGGQTDANLTRAVAVFEDALHDRPTNVAMVIRYTQVLRAAQQVAATPGHEGAAKKFEATIGDVLARIRETVKPADPGFTEVYALSADYALRNADVPQAEKLLRELVRQRPDDQSGRIALAGLLHLDPAKRPEAIDLLKKEVVDPGQVAVTQFWSRPTLEVQTAMELSKYLVEQWYAVTDAAARKAIKADLDKSFEKVAERAPQHPETLKLKAKIILLGGGGEAAVAAIPVIEQALATFHTLNSGTDRARTDWELQFMLARCYVDTRQSGEARKVLWRITEGVPGYAPAHVLLAQLLLESKEVELAATELKTLQKLIPNDPSVARLQLALLLGSNKPEEVLKYLRTLPEETAAQKKLKAQFALGSNQPAEAERLLQALLKQTPGDVEAIEALGRFWWQRGDKQKATEFVAKAAQAAPENVQLKVLLSQFRGDKPDVILREMAEAINATPDPFTRELKLFELYNAQNVGGEAIKHLDAAEKLQPANPRVLDVRFQLALNARRWDEAGRYAAKLTAANADQARGLIYAYRLAMARGDVEEGARVADEMVKSYPQYARSWTSRGQVEQARGRFEFAISAYGAALERQSENVEAIRGLIECHEALHHPSEVKRYLDRAVQLHPDDAAFRDQRLRWDLLYGRPADAVASATARRDAAPESLDAWLKLGAVCLQAAQQAKQAGNDLGAKGFSDQARQVFADTSKKWPDERLPYAYLADLAEFNRDGPAGEAALGALAAREAFKDSAEPLLLLADFELRLGRPAEAEAALLRAVDRSHGDPAVRLRLARLYATHKEVAKALAQLDENSADPAVVSLRVEIMATAGQADDAKRLLDKLLAARPKDVGLLLTRSWLMLNTNRLPEAREAAAAALKIQPDNAQARFYQGQAAMRDTPPNLPEAIRHFVAARDIVPGSVQYHQYLGEAYRLADDQPKLAAEMEAIVKLEPVNRYMRSRLVELYSTLPQPRWDEALKLITAAASIPALAGDPEWPRLEAGIWQARKEPLKAAERAKQALALAVRLPADQAQRATILERDALALIRASGQFQTLLDACNDLLKSPTMQQSGWWVYSFRGAARHGLSHDAEAKEDFDTALRLAAAEKEDDARAAVVNDIADALGIDAAIAVVRSRSKPDQPNWDLSLAALVLRKGDTSGATATIEKTLSDRSKLTMKQYLTGLDLAGSIYMRAGNYDKAAETYELILGSRPDDLPAMNNLACLYGDLKKPPEYEKALALSRRALELSMKAGPPDPNLLDTHGWMLVLSGHPAEGVKVLQAALARQPFPEGIYHLGVGLKASGSTDANATLRKARDLLAAQKAAGQPNPELEQKIERALKSGAPVTKPASP